MQKLTVLMVLAAVTNAAVLNTDPNEQDVQWTRVIQNSASPDEETPSTPSLPQINMRARGRGRRQVTSQPPPAPRTTCSLFIRSDPTLWQHVRAQFPPAEDALESSRINRRVRREILSVISAHVAALNRIFTASEVVEPLENKYIQFQLQRVQIDSISSCAPPSLGSPYCDDQLSAQALLNLHSLDNHDDFCLAYLFTFRDFGGRTSVSWNVGANIAGSAGICGKYKTYREVIDGKHVSRKRSLNTGVLSLALHNVTVPAARSHVHLAQLVGKSFGARNEIPECQSPGDRDGNYIMFPGANTGDRPNNSRYSAYSIRDMSAVLRARIGDPAKNCFTSDDSTSFCGNSVVEPGEECDCGYDERECEDRCCYPRQLSAYDMERNSTAKGCARKASTQCSPSQGPCCKETSCQLEAAHTRTLCQQATECSEASYCSGESPECPAPSTYPL